MKNAARGETFLIWAFLAPTLVFYGLYTIWPLAAGVWYSLLDWNGFERAGRFIGLSNYGELFRDRMFWNSVRATLLFMVLAVPARVVLSLLFAIPLNSPRMPGAKLFRTMLFLPVVTTAAIIGLIMGLIFDPASGPVNLVLDRLEIGKVDFFGSRYAMLTSTGIWVWKWLGISLIYWLAALQSIPTELYEAALVDGSGPANTFFRITVPLLKPFAGIIVLLTAVDATRVFELLMTMTGGGPFFKTEVVEIFIYRWAFGAGIPRLGYASAVAIVFGLLFGALAGFKVLFSRIAAKGRTE